MPVFKLQLEKTLKRCATCKFCGKFEFYVSNQDMEALKQAARTILNAEPTKLIRLEYTIALLSLLEMLQKQRVVCKKERLWVHALDGDCSLWQPRILNPET